MLIEFSVENFRSFRERQTISMVAAPRMLKRGNVFKPQLKEKKFPGLLKVAVIYGPNASGKSNLLKALSVLRSLINRSPNDLAELPVVPFKFDSALVKAPSRFDVHFVADEMRYQFEVGLTSDRIHHERLVAFPKGVEVLLYERNHHADGDSYTIGDALEGGEDLINAWQKLTSPTMLFISQAVANSQEQLTQLRKPFNWLSTGTRTVLNGMDDLSKWAREIAVEQDGVADEIAEFLREVDVPISRLKVEPHSSDKLNETSFNSLANASAKVRFSGATKSTFTHKTALGEADLTYTEQSEGTKNLIGFWLPWSLKNFKHNPASLLVVDELDSSLHPLIVEALVEKHLAAEITTQLIFSTHDTHLLDSKLLRRDQIWITDRDMNGATQLHSVHEYEGRDSEDVEKRYFEGRYRGLPFVSRG
jgi:AAA15 family ATPase/GTPase